MIRSRSFSSRSVASVLAPPVVGVTAGWFWIGSAGWAALGLLFMLVSLSSILFAFLRLKHSVRVSAQFAGATLIATFARVAALGPPRQGWLRWVAGSLITTVAGVLLATALTAGLRRLLQPGEQ